MKAAALAAVMAAVLASHAGATDPYETTKDAFALWAMHALTEDRFAIGELTDAQATPERRQVLRQESDERWKQSVQAINDYMACLERRTGQ